MADVDENVQVIEVRAYAEAVVAKADGSPRE